MRRGHAKVREFALYGENAAPGDQLHLHIEDIQFRARRYHWEIAPHRHANLCQVLFIARGPASIHVDDLKADLDGPALALVPPGTVHAFQFSEETQGYVLTLPAEQLLTAVSGDMSELLQGVFSEVFVGALNDDAPLAARLAGLFERLHAEFREPEAGAAPITAWLANSVLWILARYVARVRAASAQAPIRQRAWLRFRALAEAHYHEQWSVARYARQLGLTTGRLNRLCREQSGLTASRVLQQRLALEARRRLIYVDAPIARLAAELGFQDAAYFCRFFKRHTGASPRAFRRAAWTRQIGLSSASR
jgi:AraC family transcriptional regulator, transcriptional activator of pobA